MATAELARMALESLRSRKLCSFLTLLGIIIGVTTIVGVAAVISGLDTYVQERVIQLSPDVFVLTKFGIIRGRDEFPAPLGSTALTRKLPEATFASCAPSGSRS